MSERGHTFLELVAVLATLLITASLGLPYLKAYSVEAHLIGAGRVFKGEFLRARSIAVRTGAYSAIRFEPGPSGPSYSIYVDGNHNGVLAAAVPARRERAISAHAVRCRTSCHIECAPAMGRAAAASYETSASSSARAGPCHIGPSIVRLMWPASCCAAVMGARV